MADQAKRSRYPKVPILAAASVVLLSMFTDAISGNVFTGWWRGHYQFVWVKAVLVVLLFGATVVVLWLLAREAKGHRFIEVAVGKHDLRNFDRLIVAVSQPPLLTPPGETHPVPGYLVEREGTCVTVTTTDGKIATMGSLAEAVDASNWLKWPNSRGPNVQQFFYTVHSASAPEIILIATNESLALAQILEGVLIAWGYTAKVHEQHVELDDVMAVTDVAQGLLREERPARPAHTVVDITTGTKAMSAGLALAALEAKAVMLYVDNDHNPIFRDLRLVPSEIAKALGLTPN